GHISLSTSELIKPLLSTQAAAGTKLVSVRPETIEFYYNYGQSKVLPVVFQGKVTPDSSYSLVSLDVEPRYVRVYASRTVLDTLTAAYIEPLRLRDLTDTTSVKCRFVKVPGAKFVPQSARVTIITDRMIEKTVQVPVQGVNFPASKTLRTFPPKVNITFQVGMSQYKRITPESFVLVVNYADLLKNTDNRCHLSLKSVPIGVRRARINPADVEYVIEDSSPDELE
ncbi:MAG: YbbR-like domain-containing protein, partial [Prevotellaceae bacterium]|nr:YbbR-like domain-containing protein [Prevotellaceae bacterium]